MKIKPGLVDTVIHHLMLVVGILCMALGLYSMGGCNAAAKAEPAETEISPATAESNFQELTVRPSHTRLEIKSKPRSPAVVIVKPAETPRQGSTTIINLNLAPSQKLVGGAPGQPMQQVLPADPAFVGPPESPQEPKP